MNLELQTSDRNQPPPEWDSAEFHRGIGNAMFALIIVFAIISQYLVAMTDKSNDIFVFLLTGVAFVQPIILALMLIFGPGRFLARILFVIAVIGTYMVVTTYFKDLEDVFAADFYRRFEMIFHVPSLTLATAIPLAIQKFYAHRTIYLPTHLRTTRQSQDRLSISNLIALTTLVAMVVVSTQNAFTFDAAVQNVRGFIQPGVDDPNVVQQGMLTGIAISIVAASLFPILASRVFGPKGFFWSILFVALIIAVWVSANLLAHQIAPQLFWTDLQHVVYHGLSVLAAAVTTCLFLNALRMSGFRYGKWRPAQT